MPDPALVAAHISIMDIARLPNCGKRTIEEVRRWVESYGYEPSRQTVDRILADLERSIRDLTSEISRLLETLRMVAWVLDDSTEAELQSCKELVKRTLAELGPR
jgi:hypothetical protein